MYVLVRRNLFGGKGPFKTAAVPLDKMNDHRLVETHPKNRNRYHATTIMTRGM
jgi:hypothetical protein